MSNKLLSSFCFSIGTVPENRGKDNEMLKKLYNCELRLLRAKALSYSELFIAVTISNFTASDGVIG